MAHCLQLQRAPLCGIGSRPWLLLWTGFAIATDIRQGTDGQKKRDSGTAAMSAGKEAYIRVDFRGASFWTM